jgi:uncharacterized membrane protein YozB (DUF420 family)
MTPLIKFIHLLFALGVFSLTVYCFALIGSRKFVLTDINQPDKFNRLNIVIVIFSLFTLITGTFLVYPKHFTFHTPWIQAAYLFTLLLALMICLLINLKKKRVALDGKISRLQRLLWRCAYLAFIIILIAVVHDAVTKTTILEFFP